MNEPPPPHFLEVVCDGSVMGDEIIPRRDVHPAGDVGRIHAVVGFVGVVQRRLHRGFAQRASQREPKGHLPIPHILIFAHSRELPQNVVRDDAAHAVSDDGHLLSGLQRTLDRTLEAIADLRTHNTTRHVRTQVWQGFLDDPGSQAEQVQDRTGDPGDVVLEALVVHLPEQALVVSERVAAGGAS